MIPDIIESPVMQQAALAYSAGASAPRRSSSSRGVGYQDMGGRVTRYPMRSREKTTGDKHRDVQLTCRWMDAMGVDYACLFPTGMLNIGMHPQKEVEARWCWAYNRWLTEQVLPEGGGRIYSMLCLPFSDPEAACAQVEDFGDRKHVTGFMVTTVRNLPVHDNAYMKIYRAMEERGLTLVVPCRPNWGEPVLQVMQPLPLGACARLHLVQHRPSHQLGDQRPAASASRSCR